MYDISQVMNYHASHHVPALSDVQKMCMKLYDSTGEPKSHLDRLDANIGRMWGLSLYKAAISDDEVRPFSYAASCLRLV